MSIRSPLIWISLWVALAALTQAIAQTTDVISNPVEKPTEVAAGIFVFQGHRGPANTQNRARLANITLVTGPDGAIAWNTGVSHHHGEQLLAEMRRQTSVPIRHAIVSHAYQDVLFGWSAFSEQGIEVLMHEAAVHLMHKRCHGCLERLSELLGPEQMKGTTLAKPSRTIVGPSSLQSTGRELQILDAGHSSGPNDLMLFDQQTGTLLAGAAVMTDTLVDIRDGDITKWIEALEALKNMPIKLIVPDYGAVSNAQAIETTLVYLRELQEQVRRLLEQGVGLTDAVDNARMPDFANWPGYKEHHGRNVHQLYLQMESRFFE